MPGETDESSSLHTASHRPLIGHLAGLEQHVKVLDVKVGVAAPAFIEQLDQVQGFLRQSPFPGLVHWECLYVKHMTWQGVSHV